MNRNRVIGLVTASLIAAVLAFSVPSAHADEPPPPAQQTPAPSLDGSEGFIPVNDDGGFHRL
jgi:hypothetical protein